MKSVLFNSAILALVLYAAPQIATAQTKSASTPATLTGCLSTTDEKGEYALTSDDGKEYRLFGFKTANLAPHVGHKITVTATPTMPRMEAEEGGEHEHHHEGGEKPHFNVSKLKMVRRSCGK